MPQLEFGWEEIDRRSVPELWTPDDIYKEVNADSFHRFYEDQRLERKSAGIHADSLATYVSMWANTPPDGGLIALGVEDDGRVTGCMAKGEHVVEVERRIRNELVTDAVFTTKRVLATNDRGETNFVLLYRVQYRDDKVVETNKGEAYIVALTLGTC